MENPFAALGDGNDSVWKKVWQDYGYEPVMHFL